MKQYKTGDKVRVTNDKDTPYENCLERIYVYTCPSGFIYCVDVCHSEKYEKSEDEIRILRWRKIVEKPATITLTVDDWKLVKESIVDNLEDFILITDKKKLRNIINEINEVTK